MIKKVYVVIDSCILVMFGAVTMLEILFEPMYVYNRNKL